MIIIVKDVKVVTGQSGDEFHVGETSAATFIAQGEEDRIAIARFISQHVPTIDDEHDEECAPELPEPEE